MKKIKAILDWSLEAECDCGHVFLLHESPHDDEGEFSTPIFNNDWDKLRDKVVHCPDCKSHVVIDFVEY